jgi:hypothetical protein
VNGAIALAGYWGKIVIFVKIIFVNAMFQDWEKEVTGDPRVSRRLLWEYDYDRFDWQGGRKIVVRRVIERGWENDFHAIFTLYGGVNGVREIIVGKI